MEINQNKIVQIEGATYYVNEEPSPEQVVLFPLPVNFKVVDPQNNTFKLVSFKADGTRLELGGNGGNFLPLTGTEEDKPLTGQIRVINNSSAGGFTTIGYDFKNEFHGLRIYDPNNPTWGNQTFSLTANVEEGFSVQYGTTGNINSISLTQDGTKIMGNLDLSNEGYTYIQTANGHIEDDGSRIQISSNGGNMGLELGESGRGIVAVYEYDKQGDRNAFAQLGDVYDANSYSTNETKTGGTWIDGKPIYRKVVTGSWNAYGGNEIDIFDYTVGDVDELFIKTVKLTTGNNVSYEIANGYRFQEVFVTQDNSNGVIYLYNMGADGDPNNPAKTELNVPTEYILILEYTKTTD